MKIILCTFIQIYNTSFSPLKNSMNIPNASMNSILDYEHPFSTIYWILLTVLYNNMFFRNSYSIFLFFFIVLSFISLSSIFSIETFPARPYLVSPPSCRIIYSSIIVFSKFWKICIKKNCKLVFILEMTKL